MAIHLLKQSTAVSITVGPLIDYSDGVTPQTTVTHANITAGIIKGVTKTDITVTASGGSNDLTHIGSGLWALELTGTDTNTLGNATVFLRDDDDFLFIRETIHVLPANVYDSLVAGTDALDVSLIQVLGTAVTESGSTAGVLDVNVAEISEGSAEADRLQAALGTGNYIAADTVRVSGDATAADNLELFMDGTGYAGGTTKLGVDIVSIAGTAANATVLGYLMASSGDGSTFTVDDSSFSPTTTAFEADVTEATNDHFNGNYVRWVTGNLKYSVYQVTDYDGTNKRFTVDTMTEAPADGDVFVLT